MPKGVYIRTKPAWNKGICHLSDKAKARISKAMIERLKIKGHPRGMLGKKHTEENKKKISLSMKKNGWFPPPRTGIPRPDSFKKKMSERFKGSRSHFWKGGTTQLNIIIRQCYKYNSWRTDIFKRDNYTCSKCGKRGDCLTVDHHPISFAKIIHKKKIKNIEEALECEELWDRDNGRTLCLDCHKETDTWGSKNSKIKYNEQTTTHNLFGTQSPRKIHHRTNLPARPTDS